MNFKKFSKLKKRINRDIVFCDEDFLLIRIRLCNITNFGANNFYCNLVAT